MARVRERPSEIGARIVDRVVQLAGDQMEEWEFRKKLGDLYRDAMARIDLTKSTYQEVDGEINKFLNAEGIQPVESDLDGGD